MGDVGTKAGGKHEIPRGAERVVSTREHGGNRAGNLRVSFLHKVRYDFAQKNMVGLRVADAICVGKPCQTVGFDKITAYSWTPDYFSLRLQEV